MQLDSTYSRHGTPECNTGDSRLRYSPTTALASPPHHCAGYRPVGVRERIAQRDGTWHDTVFLERRSPIN